MAGKEQRPTVRSHYLPRTYLKNFLEEDGLFVYQKGEKFFKEGVGPDQRIISVRGEAGLNTVGLEKHLYNPGIEGITTDDIEEIFQEYGENYLSALVEEIASLETGSQISSEIKAKLCAFMAAMRVRTPEFKSEITQMDTAFSQHMLSRQYGDMSPQELVRFSREELDKEISEEMAGKLIERFKTKNFKLVYPNGHFLKFALMGLQIHEDLFTGMNMRILKSDGRTFITSDNPVVYFVPREMTNFYVSAKSLASPHTELFFPLTKSIGIYLCRKPLTETVVRASRELIDVFNFNIARNSFEYIFSSFQTKEARKYVEEYIPYPFKISVS